MAGTPVTIDLSEAQKGFVHSKATIVALIGPFGEGKTYAGFWGLVNHAKKFGDKPMYGAIIRDTFENLKNQTSKSINEAAMGFMSHGLMVARR